jgi:hypothetical protein
VTDRFKALLLRWPSRVMDIDRGGHEAAGRNHPGRRR